MAWHKPACMSLGSLQFLPAWPLCLPRGMSPLLHTPVTLLSRVMVSVTITPHPTLLSVFPRGASLKVSNPWGPLWSLRRVDIPICVHCLSLASCAACSCCTRGVCLLSTQCRSHSPHGLLSFTRAKPSSYSGPMSTEQPGKSDSNFHSLLDFYQGLGICDFHFARSHISPFLSSSPWSTAPLNPSRLGGIWASMLHPCPPCIPCNTIPGDFQKHVHEALRHSGLTAFNASLSPK